MPLPPLEFDFMTSHLRAGLVFVVDSIGFWACAFSFDIFVNIVLSCYWAGWIAIPTSAAQTRLQNYFTGLGFALFQRLCEHKTLIQVWEISVFMSSNSKTTKSQKMTFNIKMTYKRKMDSGLYWKRPKSSSWIIHAYISELGIERKVKLHSMLRDVAW